MIVSGRVIAVCAVLFWALPAQAPAQAQVPPGDADSAAYTGLHAAAAKGDVAAIARLGADKSLLNARDGHGRTPLMVAAHARRHAAAAALIAAGADLDALVAAGAPLDHVNNLNWTALIESIVLGDGGANHVACLKALVDAGANVNIPDGSGVSPLGLAQRRGFGEMVKILKAAGPGRYCVCSLVFRNFTSGQSSAVLSRCQALRARKTGMSS
mgnify:CR=1 FL=1